MTTIQALAIFSPFVALLIIVIAGYSIQKQRWKNQQHETQNYEIELELKSKIKQIDEEILSARQEMESEKTLLYQQTVNELEQIRETHREETLRQAVAEAEREFNRQVALMTEEKDKYVQYLTEELEQDSMSFMQSANTLRFTADKLEDEVKDIASRLVALVETEKTLLNEQRQKTHQLPLSREDINDLQLLMQDILPRIRREDIIRKLIWAEYIQKPTTELVNSIFSSSQPGIYKITNVKNKKSYIGRSVNTRSRIVEHIKSSLGLGSIADQAIHHAMREEGLENFMFELLEDCEKDKLAEREKYYIDIFQSNIHGYNKNKGG